VGSQGRAKWRVKEGKRNTDQKGAKGRRHTALRPRDNNAAVYQFIGHAWVSVVMRKPTDTSNPHSQ